MALVHNRPMTVIKRVANVATKTLHTATQQTLRLTAGFGWRTWAHVAVIAVLIIFFRN